MNEALFRLAEYGKSISVKALCDYVGGRTYESFKGRIRKRSVVLTTEEKQLVSDRLDNRIRELVKIKILVDKNI